MELKLVKRKDTRLAVGLLTVPEWNWNKWTPAPQGTALPFNRTRMELKQNGTQDGHYRKTTFNRTRMELKRAADVPTPDTLHAFNRTRMELKHNYLVSLRTIWNAFNRTRMELKLWFKLMSMRSWILLTVPEWNWNALPL